MNKLCKKCGLLLPVISFRVQKDKRSGKGYVLNTCKKCEMAYNSAWREKNLERAKERARGYAKKRRERNPEKARAYNKRWRDEHLERVHQQVKARKLKNPIRERELSGRRRKRYLVKHRKRIRLMQKAWEVANPAACKIINLKRNITRRVRLYGSTPLDKMVTSSDRKELLQMAEKHGRCVYCGCVPDKSNPWWYEHATPLGAGGQDLLNNVFFCCRKCNQSKNDKTLEEWKGITFNDIPKEIRLASR